MDLASVLGVFLGFFFIGVSLLLTVDFYIPGLIIFADAASVMIVVGGVISATLISYPLAKIMNSFKAVKTIFSPPSVDPAFAIDSIIKLANLARKEGILALEDAAKDMNDIFLQKGIMLIVDGTDPELTRNIMETELSYLEERHSENKGIWEAMASLGPAWGMIGTLIGLIAMLAELDDPSTLGPKMAVALITTFYGSLIANYICTPFATKLKTYSGEEILVKSVLIEGILSIQAGENPRIIEEKLKSFLAPTLRSSVGESDKAGD